MSSVQKQKFHLDHTINDYIKKNISKLQIDLQYEILELIHKVLYKTHFDVFKTKLREIIDWNNIFSKTANKSNLIKLMIDINANLNIISKKNIENNGPHYRIEQDNRHLNNNILHELLIQMEKQELDDLDSELVYKLAQKNITGDKGYPNRTPLEVCMLKKWHRLVRLFLENGSGHKIDQNITLDYLKDISISKNSEQNQVVNFKHILKIHYNLGWRFFIYYLEKSIEKNEVNNIQKNDQLLLKRYDSIKFVNINKINIEDKVNQMEILGQTFKYRVIKTNKAFLIDFMNQIVQKFLGEERFMPQSEIMIQDGQVYLIQQVLDFKSHDEYQEINAEEISLNHYQKLCLL